MALWMPQPPPPRAIAGGGSAGMSHWNCFDQRWSERTCTQPRGTSKIVHLPATPCNPPNECCVGPPASSTSTL
eukprot:3066687-Prymnesium_polylepis.1